VILGYRVAQVRAAEERAFADVGADTLMQRAAAGLATAVMRRLPLWTRTGAVYGARVLLVLGSGNNGGDALYAGVRLARRGVSVSAWRVGSTVHENGWAAFLAAGGREVDRVESQDQLSRLDAVIDGVAGIGSRPGLSSEVAGFADRCVALGVPVVAVDLPSGLAPEPPFVDAPHFRAALTVTFGGHKLCQLMEPAKTACGEVQLVDIGLRFDQPALRQWTASDLVEHWPVPDACSDKYSRGVVGLNTGSTDYPGAAVLGAAGATHAGAGMVRYLGPADVARAVVAHLPNVVSAPGRVQALVLGSGWGNRGPAAAVAEAVASGMPLVIDADALRHLPERGRLDVLLTPHAGELAYLLGEDRDAVTADPMTAVRHAADRTGCTVLVKGASQYLATPDDAVVECALPGPAWTAQAGSGDVLAGIAGAVLAAGRDARIAGVAAASMQACAASSTPGPVTPQELAAVLPQAIDALLREQP